MLRSIAISCLFLVGLAAPTQLLAEATHTPSSFTTKPAALPIWQYTLLRTIPREKNHFTEGLVFAGNTLFESTGHYGESRLHAYNANDLAPLKQVDLPANRFGEGITVLRNKLYQLNWKGGDIFVYNLDLELQDTLRITGDGWGLTTDGDNLIMSDGSATVFFRDRDTARELRRITVSDASGKRWDNLNELEWINGVILANVWHQDTVLAIDPQSGQVVGQYDFERLSQIAGKQMPGRNGEQVLNGMAWNPSTQTLLLTGKDWPLWFEVVLSPVPSINSREP